MMLASHEFIPSTLYGFTPSMRKQPSPTAQNVMERGEIHSKHFLAA
jgi:hypothetical protein